MECLLGAKYILCLHNRGGLGGWLLGISVKHRRSNEYRTKDIIIRVRMFMTLNSLNN